METPKESPLVVCNGFGELAELSADQILDGTPIVELEGSPVRKLDGCKVGKGGREKEGDFPGGG